VVVEEEVEPLAAAVERADEAEPAAAAVEASPVLARAVARRFSVDGRCLPSSSARATPSAPSARSALSIEPCAGESRPAVGPSGGRLDPRAPRRGPAGASRTG
jgi:hypothetical protein